MMYRMALPVLAFLLASGGCSGPDATSPVDQNAAAAVTATGASFARSSARSGELHVRKECHLYSGGAGEICTITSSNVREIEVGSTITYESGAVAGFLDTDVVLDPPGPGNNKAFGHCTLSLVTGIGECRFSGGTGKFTWFNARVAVSPLGWPDFAWDGTYSYGP